MVVLACVGALFLSGAWPGSGKDPAGAEYLSPCCLTAGVDGQRLYIAEFTANRVAVMDTAREEVINAYELPQPPSGMACSSDGSRLFVTGASPDGKVHVIDLEKGEVIGSMHAGHTPCAPVVSMDGKTLYVCNRFDNDISVIDIESGNECARIAVVREPVAAALTSDGGLLYVANHLPGGPADGYYTAAVVSIVDTAEMKVANTIELPNGSTGVRGVCFSMDGKYVYVTHVLARYQLPTTQLERGWMNTNALSVIDVKKQALLNTVLLDDVDLGAANPWGVVCTGAGTGGYVCVALAGTHELCVIEQAALHDRLDRAASGEKVTAVTSGPDDVQVDLSFLVGIKKRFPLTGKGPRALVANGDVVYVAEYFTDSISAVDLGGSDISQKPVSIPLAPDRQAPTMARRGEICFNDAMLCFQRWQSCASCHPGARADGLNWDLMNDGMGNHKNTKSLLLVFDTPPMMITGIRDNAKMAVRAGIRHIQFAVRPEEDAEAIDAYLKSIRPVPSPFLEDGKLSAAAERGKEHFFKSGCAVCHPGPIYTDLKAYDVGTGKRREKGAKLDTPTLIETWRTGPWLNDGRAETMRDMLKKHNRGDMHGAVSELSEDETSDLVEYVLSL